MTQYPHDDPTQPGHGKPRPPSSGQQPPDGPSGYGAPPPPPPSQGWNRPGGGPQRPGPLGGGEQEERQWALFAHLGGVLAIFPVVHLLPALAILSIYRTRSDFIQDQAREALNFQIVILIAFFVAKILDVLPLFPNLVWLVWLFSLIFSVLAAVASSRGERYRYPLTYRFLA